MSRPVNVGATGPFDGTDNPHAEGEYIKIHVGEMSFLTSKGGADNLAAEINGILKTPQKFTPGDIVRLRSGGPSLTVTNTTEDEVWCSFFNNTQDLITLKLPLASLEKEPKNIDRW